MTNSILSDAFEHHIWANDRILEACEALTPNQLDAAVPGIYGPIIDTIRHLVQGDSFYLWIFRDQTGELIPDENELSVAELRAANRAHAAEYEALLAKPLDPESIVINRGDGSEFRSRLGVRIAQVVHHGTDHRSQVCTALTNLGFSPPDIDVWAYGEAAGRTWDVVTASS